MNHNVINLKLKIPGEFALDVELLSNKKTLGAFVRAALANFMKSAKGREMFRLVTGEEMSASVPVEKRGRQKKSSGEAHKSATPPIDGHKGASAQELRAVPTITSTTDMVPAAKGASASDLTRFFKVGAYSGEK